MCFVHFSNVFLVETPVNNASLVKYFLCMFLDSHTGFMLCEGRRSDLLE